MATSSTRRMGLEEFKSEVEAKSSACLEANCCIQCPLSWRDNLGSLENIAIVSEVK
ncbi:hypothetical protein MPTK1_3g15490 [Marchantia polymorpha subsp. ruderalis]|uniref:Uncharacterized protein n=2 Tax=Marchantia polymorpha TaxID=3197 RepID=A0AAF6B143_MARPO|nr:hypothetical protein MARPO_0004s0123 [Marchantia polymorpha]BBN05727.1 hypothetical protein Mp_3g15490 [Marchantia polymorpha subsp. ruderalis]|eukprot:PTQ48855.1 hypothetical protein MARPO_0004s0123 [Marchantia polymorpha]